jgi:hypothetical protein
MKNGLQQSLFPMDGLGPEPESVAPQAAATEPSRALRVVAGGGAPLGKTQKKFNKLLARIENLRAERLRSVARWDDALSEYARRIHPLTIRLHAGRCALVRALAIFWRTPKGLGKRQRVLLREFLMAQFDELEKHEPTEAEADLVALHDDLYADLVAEEKKRVENVARGAPESDDEDASGLDYSKLRPDMSPEEQIRELARQMAEAQGFSFGGDGESGQAETEGRPRKRTAAQARKEQREAELAEARKRGVSTIYKQLAKALHPDLERDPERRLEKERLMQELTVAYHAGDLHTLLRLELEFIHREQGDLNHLGEEKLKIYCELLQEQVSELERDVAGVIYDPRYAALRPYVNPFSARMPDWYALESELGAQSHAMRRSVEALRGAEAKLELKEALRVFSAEQRRRARFGGFFGAF